MSFTFFFKTRIISQKSCPHTSQQNGIAEQKHRHILDVTRTLLLDAYVPPTFWDEAVRTTVFLINRQISEKLVMTIPIFGSFRNNQIIVFFILLAVFALCIYLTLNVVDFLLK